MSRVNLDALLDGLAARDQAQRYQGSESKQRLHTIGDASGKAINLLVRAIRPRTIVEIGTGVGYSTLWLAGAASVIDAHVTSIELDVDRLLVAERLLHEAELLDYVTLIRGDALTVLATSPPADLYLLDAEKTEYVHYARAIVERCVDRRFVLLADNVLSHRGPVHPFLTYLDDCPAMTHLLLPLGKGIEFAVGNG